MQDGGIIQIISNVGFPVAVAVYLLTRFESKIEKLETAINNLGLAMWQKNNEVPTNEEKKNQ